MKTASFFSYFGPGKISIATRPPKAMVGMTECRRLAPRYDMLNMQGAVDEAAYRERVLSRLDPAEVWRVLHERAGEGVEPVICCYERDPSGCHRSLVAAWIKQQLGEDVAEYVPTAADGVIGPGGLRQFALDLLADRAPDKQLRRRP